MCVDIFEVNKHSLTQIYTQSVSEKKYASVNINISESPTYDIKYIYSVYILMVGGFKFSKPHFIDDQHSLKCFLSYRKK